MAKMNGAGYATVNINVLYVAMVYGGKECIGVCSFFFLSVSSVFILSLCIIKACE